MRHEVYPVPWVCWALPLCTLPSHQNLLPFPYIIIWECGEDFGGKPRLARLGNGDCCSRRGLGARPLLGKVAAEGLAGGLLALDAPPLHHRHRCRQAVEAEARLAAKRRAPTTERVVGQVADLAGHPTQHLANSRQGRHLEKGLPVPFPHQCLLWVPSGVAGFLHAGRGGRLLPG